MNQVRLAAGLILALLGMGLSAPAPAQPSARQANPELVARNYRGPNGDQPTHPLTLGKLDVAVDILGGVARTVVTASFQNPTNTPLEGDFTLDLPTGSVVTGYALDVNGAMVDGVLVGQRKASLVYKQRVRRGADPGIAEVTRDNAFRTHVFPIMPGRGRTIRLEFASPLGPDRPYALPLSTLDPVGAVSILIKAPAGAAPPPLTGPDGLDGLDLQWKDGAEGLVARAAATAASLSGALTIGAPPHPQPVTLTRHHSGDSFFEIDAAPPTHPAPPSAQGGRVRLYWDRSLSRRGDDTAAEIALVGRYLTQVQPQTIELITFASDGPKLQTFQSPTAADEAIAALKAVDYHGATSLRGVFTAAPGPADTCLMVSDGNVTLDPYQLERVRCPLFTLTSASDANHGFLAALAHRSGGEALDLGALSPDSILARLTDRGARVVAVTASDGEALDFTPLSAGPGRIHILGRVANPGPVTLTLADGQTLKFDLDGLEAAAHDGAGALWASDRVAELNATDRPDQAKSLGFARQYGVAGGDAVYLVLETLQDYLEAEITPPDSAGKALLANYANALAQKKQQEKAAQDRRLNDVVAEWREQKAWWSGKIEAPAKTESSRAGPPPRIVPRPPVPVASPAPPPPPALALPPAPKSEAPARDDVVVTAQRVTSRPGRVRGVLYDDANETAATVVARLNTAERPDQGIKIEVQPWDPQRPYLKALKATGPEGFWTAFKDQERKYGSSPAFYLDVAEYLFRNGRAAEAAPMALNALELATADTTTLTVLADRMMRYGDETRAIWLYEKVLYLDPDRPQPRRLLALALIERAEHAAKAGAPAQAQRADDVRAMQLLNEVVTRTWPPAFSQIELVALMEANHLIPTLKRLGVHDIPLDPRLRANLDVDLRVVLDWYVDATDMDLWVDEPSGERAIYSHPRTASGGRLSHDMTQGYGPEEYLLRRAPDGDYVVRVNIYRTDQLNPNGPITVRAHLFRGYGRPDERSQILEIELKPGEDGARVVGRINVSAKP